MDDESICFRKDDLCTSITNHEGFLASDLLVNKC